MEATLAAPGSTYRRDLRCYYRSMILISSGAIMMLASVLAALALTLVPWGNLLTHVTVARAAVVSLFAVFMPVPISRSM